MKNERIDFTPALLRNHFKVTLRKIQRQKGYTLINVSGLAVGLACCAIMLLLVRNENVPQQKAGIRMQPCICFNGLAGMITATSPKL